MFLVSAQKMKIFIKDFRSKCGQIRWKQSNWLNLLKKSVMKNFIFCAVSVPTFVAENSKYQVKNLPCKYYFTKG